MPEGREAVRVAERLRVVVVDDVDVVRGLVCELVEAGGHDVIGEASGGAAGVAMTVASRPDVVIMDWRMPGIDGVEATRRICASCPGVRVVAFSSAPDEAIRAAFLDAGATAYVDKAQVDRLATTLTGLSNRHVTPDGANAPATSSRVIGKLHLDL